jgi:hypothetical protein
LDYPGQVTTGHNCLIRHHREDFKGLVSQWGPTTHTPSGAATDYQGMQNTVTAPVTCERCDRPAVYETPHGLLCLDHTREVMDADPSLWMPRNIDEVDTEA